MCKVVAFTNMKKLNVRSLSNFLGNVLLSEEKDGFGYAIQGESGLYGEKCVAPEFRSRISFKHEIKMPIVKKRYELFGQVTRPAGPGIFHGRTSTNDDGLLNCHPMQRKNWALVHNGVVTDTGEPYAKYTTNDSEDLLHRLTIGIDEVQRCLYGYYAFAAIDPGGNLHICRDDIAELYIAALPKFETFMIATTQELILATCKFLKIECEPIDLVDDNIYITFTGNELIYSQSIKTLGFRHQESQFAEKSLGRVIDASGKNYVTESLWSDNEDEKRWYTVMDELENMDASYTIVDAETKEPVEHSVFSRLTTMEKESCIVVRPDGSQLDWDTWTWEFTAA